MLGSEFWQYLSKVDCSFYSETFFYLVILYLCFSSTIVLRPKYYPSKVFAMHVVQEIDLCSYNWLQFIFMLNYCFTKNENFTVHARNCIRDGAQDIGLFDLNFKQLNFISTNFHYRLFAL